MGQKKGDMTMEPEFAVMYSEDGGEAKSQKNARSWKKQGNNSVLRPPKECSRCYCDSRL